MTLIVYSKKMHPLLRHWGSPGHHGEDPLPVLPPRQCAGTARLVDGPRGPGATKDPKYLQ